MRRAASVRPEPGSNSPTSVFRPRRLPRGRSGGVRILSRVLGARRPKAPVAGKVLIRPADVIHRQAGVHSSRPGRAGDNPWTGRTRDAAPYAGMTFIRLLTRCSVVKEPDPHRVRSCSRPADPPAGRILDPRREDSRTASRPTLAPLQNICQSRRPPRPGRASGRAF